MSEEPVVSHEGSDLEAQICALKDLDLLGLRDVWRSHWGAVPNLRSVGLLRRIIAWRLQAGEEGA